MATNLSEVEALLDSQSAAMRAKDLDRLMAMYSSDIVYFDVVPPLQFVGAAALRERFSHWFDGYQGPIDMEIRDLTVSAGGDIAVAYWLSRAQGTLRNGRQVGSWVRVTSCLRRSGPGWSTTHEHASLPVDMGSGRGAMDLVPD